MDTFELCGPVVGLQVNVIESKLLPLRYDYWHAHLWWWHIIYSNKIIRHLKLSLVGTWQGGKQLNGSCEEANKSQI